MTARTLVARAATRELLTYDLGPLREVAARTVYGAAKTVLATGSPHRQAQALKALMRLHSGAFSPSVDRRITSLLRQALHDRKNHEGAALSLLFRQTAAEAAHRHRTSPKPTRILDARALVVKGWTPRERGVLVVDYSYVFPLMLGLFDLQKVADRYTLVLEPSWAGASNPDILLFNEISKPVYVQTIEPRDRNFLNALQTNLRVVPLAANWWVDPRMAPPPAAHRDIDVIMVAAWADIKRHWRVFRALRELRRQGHRLAVALVGYRYDRTREDIEALAAHFGIRDQVTTHERISHEEVSALLARSKVHVLWSRRECANRAIVEAMLADVPVIVREGLTFGYRYPYINEQTGRFVREGDLAQAILQMIAERDRYRPREWVLANMTCERATAVLNEHLKREALAAGAPWSEDLVVKTSTLDTQRYFHPEDAARFEADYRFLESCRREGT
jgi:glycosyltransferase involved in cell wall biosynthesis